MINDITKTLKHAKACHEAWWFMFGENSSRTQVLKFRDKYLALFETIKPALYISFVVKLSSIFDENPDSISLKTLVQQINQSTNSTFRAKRIDFDDLWKRGRKLFKYRNKIIAHRDKKIPSKNFAKETGFMYNDLKAILDDASIYLDELLSFIGRKKGSQLSVKSDFEQLIKDLQ